MVLFNHLKQTNQIENSFNGKLKHKWTFLSSLHSYILLRLNERLFLYRLRRICGNSRFLIKLGVLLLEVTVADKKMGY